MALIRASGGRLTPFVERDEPPPEPEHLPIDRVPVLYDGCIVGFNVRNEKAPCHRCSQLSTRCAANTRQFACPHRTPGAPVVPAGESRPGLSHRCPLARLKEERQHNTAGALVLWKGRGGLGKIANATAIPACYLNSVFSHICIASTLVGCVGRPMVEFCC